MFLRLLPAAGLVLGLVAAAPAARAAELVFGAGASRYNHAAGRDSAVLSLAWRQPAAGRFLGASAGGVLAADLHGRGDAFAGYGLALRWQAGADWFIDAALVPGIYLASGQGNRLGGNFQFRSEIALGRWFGRNAISLAVSHKSNAHLRSFNPGLDTISLRWHYRLR